MPEGARAAAWDPVREGSWLDEIGRPDDNLLHIDTNLRYGCTILKYYLDKEKGDLRRALGRYNGSRGKATYPNLVFGARKAWDYKPTLEA